MTSLQDLSQLPVSSVRTNAEIVAGVIEDANPRINASRGVVASLIAQPQAIIATQRNSQIETLRRSLSLLEISKDPALADPELVDAAASNFGKARIPGDFAQGLITIVVRVLEPVIVPLQTIFTAGSVSFVTEQSYAARTKASDLLTDNDRLLVRRGDNLYAFTIPVVATTVGISGQLAKNTNLVTNSNINNFVKAFVAEDFTGGVNVETNEQLLARLWQGVTSKTLGSRQQMSASLFENVDFGSVIVRDSIIGFGDSEMRRDRVSLLPLGVPGCVDWYIQTKADLLTVSKVVTATLQSVDATGNTFWQAVITQAAQGNDNAVWYRANTVRRKDDADVSVGSFTILSQLRTRQNVVEDSYIYPQLSRDEFAAFTYFQNLTINFVVPYTEADTSWAVNTQLDFAFELVGQPQLPLVQKTYSQRSRNNPAATLLIKAPIPCICRFEAWLSVPQNFIQAARDLEIAAKTELTAATAAYSFSGFLPAAKLLQVTQQVFAGLSLDVTRFNLTAEIITPQGESVFIEQRDGISIAEYADGQLSARTVGFYLNAENVSFNFLTR